MLKAIIFDLDDTLYEERDYFRSGFEAVAYELEHRAVGSTKEIVTLLEYFHHEESREGVFQKLASKLGFPSPWIPDLVSIFRSHKPVIALTPDSREILPLLRKTYRIGCVTDGWAAVQRRKIQALDVEAYLDVVIVADEWGREYWKPHPFPLLKCCEQLEVSVETAIFVGDNPSRDMLGAHNANMLSIRIRRMNGYFSNTTVNQPSLSAHFEIHDLHELKSVLETIEKDGLKEPR